MNMKKILFAVMSLLVMTAHTAQAHRHGGGGDSVGGAFVGSMAGSMVGTTIANSASNNAAANAAQVQTIPAPAPVSGTDSNLMYIMMFLGGFAVLGLLIYVFAQAMRKN